MKTKADESLLRTAQLWAKTHRRMAWIALASAICATVMISCATMTGTTFAPPGIPGAEFTGSESCAECHAELVRDFKTASHARLKAPGEHALNVGCESCHGPGSVHQQSGGARNTIINPGKSPEACFQCHLEVASRFRLPNHHPVLEGKMSCADCHDSHKGPAIIGGGTALSTEQDTCGKCHIAQRGPFVFEHEAIREGCTTCHQPHGTINARMLIERSASLCLKCHFQQQTSVGIFIGGQEHSTRLTRGTCWSVGCHEAVHGSQIGSSLRF
jgi:predicted CXXCH cytochrome family protein